MKLPRLFRRNEQAQQTRSYDAATSSPRRFQAGQSRFSAYGPETVAAGPMIRSRARYSAENNGLAAAAIAAWTDSAVGPGLMPTSQHPDPAIRTALDTGFRNWAKRADASGRSDFAGIQAAVVRAERIDGEAFVMWQGGKLLHLPPEQLADLTTDTIAAGVELGDDSQAIAFHVHPSRPDGIQATYAPPVRVCCLRDAAYFRDPWSGSNPWRVGSFACVAHPVRTRWAGRRAFDAIEGGGATFCDLERSKQHHGGRTLSQKGSPLSRAQ